jgi:hypothetical protein
MKAVQLARYIDCKFDSIRNSQMSAFGTKDSNLLLHPSD